MFLVYIKTIFNVPCISQTIEGAACSNYHVCNLGDDLACGWWLRTLVKIFLIFLIFLIFFDFPDFLVEIFKNLNKQKLHFGVSVITLM